MFVNGDVTSKETIVSLLSHLSSLVCFSKVLELLELHATIKQFPYWMNPITEEECGNRPAMKKYQPITENSTKQLSQNLQNNDGAREHRELHRNVHANQTQ